MADSSSSGPSPGESPTPPLVARQRRAHQKSRTGCRNCKRRKVKCDEKPPSCWSCTRFSLPCDLAKTSDIQSAPPTTERQLCLPRRRRGRPSKNWADDSSPSTGSEPPTNQPQTAPPVPLPSPPSSTPLLFFNPLDLHLLHHYLSSTAATLGEPAFWRDSIPSLAFAPLDPNQPPPPHHLQRLLLAISALHLLHQQKQKQRQQQTQQPPLSTGTPATDLQTAAEHHFTAGLRALTALLPSCSRPSDTTTTTTLPEQQGNSADSDPASSSSSLSSESGRALYASAVLVCFATFASRSGPLKGGGSGSFFGGDGKEGEVAWVGVMRGVRFVVREVGFAAILLQGGADGGGGGGGGRVGGDGKVEGEKEERCESEDDRTEETIGYGNARCVISETDGWENALAGLAELIEEEVAEVDRSVYRKALDGLARSFRGVYGAEDERFPAVMAWPYCMDDEFVRCLVDRQPIALLLLAHFAVLIQLLEPSFWFLDGWAESIVIEVTSLLGEPYKRRLTWPKDRVGQKLRWQTDG